MGAGQANLYGLVFLLPAVLFILIPYIYLWPEKFSKASIKAYLDARETLTFLNLGFGTLIIVFGIVAHELLHGLGWSFYTKKGWKSIKFGVMWKYLTPYCHCSEPLLLKSYRFGSLLPAIVLGIIPSLISLFTGQLGLMLFGFFFTFAAGGDFMMLWLLRREKSAVFVQDHPEKIGCIIFENPQD